jgi:hypothetical protein
MLNRQLVFTNSTITVDGQSVGASYSIPFGDPNQYNSELIGFFTITGSPTLANSLSITNSGNPTSPTIMTFVSSAAINLNGNTVTIFGLSLTQTQASNPFAITVVWNGSAWQTPVLARIEIPDTGVSNGMMSVMSPYTVKMNSGGTTTVPQDTGFADAISALNVDHDFHSYVIDFNSGYLDPTSNRQDIYLPHKGEVTRIFIDNYQAFSTDDAIVDVGIAGSPGGGFTSINQFTIPAGTPAGTFTTFIPSTNNTFNAGNYLVFDYQKTTWGGRSLFTIVTKRTF